MAEDETATHWSAVTDAWDKNVDDVERHSVAATDAMFRAVAVQPGDHVLELAAGPGALAARWSELVGPQGRVVLSDIAPGMADAARRRSAALANVDVEVLDASAINRPDASFHVVVCRMGLMFTPDPAAAFGEIRRVLAPGGRFAALTWAGIEHNPWMTCVGMAAMINGVTAGGPPTAPGGIFSLADPDHLAALAEHAELRDVRVEQIPTTFHAESVDAHVERVSSLAGPLAAAFGAATPEQLGAVRRTAADLAADHVKADGTVALPGRALLVAGRC